MKTLIATVTGILLAFLIFSPVVAQESSKPLVLKIEGMTWTLCGSAVQSALQKVDGVKKAEVDWKKGEARVIYDPAKVTADRLVEAVNKTGFKVKSTQ